MAKYEHDDDIARLSEARRVLEKMQKHLARMTAGHVLAEEHLSKLTVDEACNPPKLGGCGYRGLLERRQLPLSNSLQPARLPVSL
jgi:hypothetical protein